MTDHAAATPPARSGDGDDGLALEFLQSVVHVAQAIFGAAASSVFLLDEPACVLVFQAVSGQGEEFLVGTRFPANRGIAGWVAMTGEPMIVNDLAADPTFARDLAESTHYVPEALMAAPLIHGGRVLGVLEVLDPNPQSRSSLTELGLLTLFAAQAATALRMVSGERTASRVHPAPGVDAASRVVEEMTADGRAAGIQLIDALKELLSTGI
jgi:GAF domain-containing protein